jgi:hypothetical protein
MENFDAHKWFKKQYLKEANDIEENVERKVTDEIVDIRFKGQPKNFEDFMTHFLSPDIEKVFGQWLDLNFREKGITINDILSDIEDGLYRGDIKP